MVEGAGVHSCGMDKEEGRREEVKNERNLIFSSVIQSSEALALPLRLYDTMMVGSE